VLAAALRLGPDDRPGAAARAEHPGAGQVGLTQHVGDGVAGTGQVVKGLLGDAVVAVGFADGQGQPEHQAGCPPPCFAEAAFGGEGDRGFPQTVVVSELAVPDTASVGVGELPARAEQQKLTADGRRADPQVIDRFGGGNAQLVEQGPRPGTVGGPAPDWSVQRLRGGETIAGQDRHELRGPPADRGGDPLRVIQADSQQTQPAELVGVDVAVMTAPPAPPQAGMQPPPRGAGTAIGVLRFLAQPRQTRHCPMGQ
jgi:hypothetical protein